MDEDPLDVSSESSEIELPSKMCPVDRLSNSEEEVDSSSSVIDEDDPDEIEAIYSDAMKKDGPKLDPIKLLLQKKRDADKKEIDLTRCGNCSVSTKIRVLKFKCARCNAVSYCSAKCRDYHYAKNHRRECKPK